MRKTLRLVPVVALLTLSLGGCSNKPEASDVKELVSTTWDQCNFFRFRDIKKENGADNGRTYDMLISYRVEVVKNIQFPENEEELTRYVLENCPNVGIVMNNLRPIGINHLGMLKQGQVLEFSEQFRMIKSEQGWVVLQ